jgi:hypothetical protein
MSSTPISIPEASYNVANIVYQPSIFGVAFAKEQTTMSGDFVFGAYDRYAYPMMVCTLPRKNNKVPRR